MPQLRCPEATYAAARAYRLSELPQEIRDDLILLTENSMGDSDTVLLHSDSPSPFDLGLPTTRFAQALLFGDRWFVQFEITMMAGVQTVSYGRQPDGRYRRLPMHQFKGPPCESIRAALAGVTTPAGF